MPSDDHGFALFDDTKRDRAIASLWHPFTKPVESRIRCGTNASSRKCIIYSRAFAPSLVGRKKEKKNNPRCESAFVNIIPRYCVRHTIGSERQVAPRLASDDKFRLKLMLSATLERNGDSYGTNWTLQAHVRNSGISFASLKTSRALPRSLRPAGSAISARPVYR